MLRDELSVAGTVNLLFVWLLASLGKRGGRSTDALAPVRADDSSFDSDSEAEEPIGNIRRCIRISSSVDPGRSEPTSTAALLPLTFTLISTSTRRLSHHP